MQSIWDYLRTRTKDSMLAGMQDALEQAERGDQTQDAEQPRNVTAQLVGTVGGNSLPAPSPHVGEVIEAAPESDRDPASGLPEPDLRLDSSTAAADRLRETMRNETQPLDPFEERLRQTNPQFAEPYQGQPPRKRGRPRKNPEK